MIDNKYLMFLLDRYYLIAQIQYETLLGLYEITQGDVFRKKLEIHRSKSWKDFVDPEFETLYQESKKRNLAWSPNSTQPGKELVAKRGELQRYVMGALRDCIANHGPITKDLIPSATKRISGAVTTWCYEQSKHNTK